MAGLTNAYANIIADHFGNGNTTTAKPTSISVALYINGSGPTDAGGGTKLSYTNYADVSTAIAPTGWDAGSNGVFQNNGAITFPLSGGTSQTAGHFARFLNGGATMMDYGDLAATKLIEVNDIPEFADGDLDVSYNAN